MAVDVSYTVPAGGAVYAGRLAPGGAAVASFMAELASMQGAIVVGAAPPPPSPPPPPPPPSGTITGPTITAAVTATRNWAMGHAFRRGDLPAGASLSGLQTTVLSTWPDGSARHAIVAGSTSFTSGASAAISMVVGSAASGATINAATLQARAPTVVVDGGAFGSASFSGSDWASPFDTDATGPAMAHLRYRKQIGSDAHLVAFVECRVYADGATEWFPPYVENGYLQVASPTNKSATWTCTINGSSVFSGAIDFKNHQRSPLISGAALRYWTGAADPGLVVQHDRAYFMQTRVVSTYTATTSPSSSVVTSQPSTYTPLQQGSYPVGMGAGGYHPSIGVLPQWDALYLTTTAQMGAVIERQAMAAGRYGIHFRDETTNRPAKLSSYPNLVLNGSSGIAATGSSTIGTETPGATGGSPPSFYTSHHPSMGYMAYLLTGWRYHLETAQFVAVANAFKQSDSTRSFTQGILKPNAGANTVRGAGWALRSLAQAASITPDADPLKAELIAQLGHNVEYFHARYVAQPNNPLGWVTPYSDYSRGSDDHFTAAAGSTTSAVVLPSGASGSNDAYTNRYCFIGAHGSTGPQKKLIVGYVGSTRTATLESPFTLEGGQVMEGRALAIGHGEYEGTTQTGSTTTTIVLPSGASAIDGIYVGRYASIRAHGASTPGQRRTITAYTGSTRTATVSPAFTLESGTMPARDVCIGDGITRDAWWMQDFVTAAAGLMVALDPFTDLAKRTKMRGFFQWKARSVIDRFGDAQTHNFLHRDAAQYEGPVAPCDYPDFDTGRGPWYANPGEMWSDLYAVSPPVTPPTRTAGDNRGGNYPSASSYWGNLMPALWYAVEEGIVGAIEAVWRMTEASNWSALAASLNDSPEWAHGAWGGIAFPAWRVGLTPWQWVELPGTALSSRPPTVASAGQPNNKIDSWCGAALKIRFSDYMIGAAGGHTDYAGNDVNRLRAGIGVPAWSEVRASTPFASLYSNSPYYADHRPGAAHTYHASQHSYQADALIVYMRTGISGGFPGVSDPPGGWPYANSDGWSKVFRLDLADWVAGNAAYLPVPYNSAFAALSGVNTDTALSHSNPKNDDHYMSGSAGGGWWKFNAATRTWSATGGGNRSPWYAGAAVDWTRNQLWVVGGFAATAPLLMNLEGTINYSVTYTGDGVGSVTFAGGYPTAVYDSWNDTRLAFFQNGTGAIQCRRVNCATQAVSTPTMTGSIPGDRINGIHNSVRYAPELRGVIAKPSYTQNARFMATA